ncbi:Radical SAM domain protein [Gemmatirosa kalamazoonensis]|uniref:Radical SAM domain protein n=1 Tax=Gemmatirosa kalamazoonensis TaxID=861299 RepID=W0RDJ3_9BACT|nr:radical SAM protein [Gemmatirosa kalamazoonensis]AHG88385.1 Radical SAM domain protein [Gemmatirosa kalamazoonensis]
MILLASSFFLRHDPKQRARMKPYPPLATLLVAAALRERGHRVALFDATLADDVDAFVARLDATRPAVVGILEDNFNYLTKMCTERSREATLAMVRAARARGCRVAVNGSDATDHPARYLDAGAHAVLPGEADATFLALADAWRDDADASLVDLAGLALADGAGGVAYTAGAPSVRDLDALPFPAWDLVDVETYRHAWRDAHGRFSWNMVTSRGCPFGCNWCAKPIFGRRYVQRAPELVAEELARLRATVRPDHVWFADDIFGLTASWIARFADAVADRGARTPFTIQCRADLLTPDVASALARAGAEEVWIGVESGSQGILDAMDKGTTVDEVRAATRALKTHGVRAAWFLQLGYPSETWADLLATRDLVRDERPDDVGVSVAYPLPGTKFHARVRDELGRRQNWRHTDDLAMLFHGTYTTPFYRRVRDALHHEVRTGARDDGRWASLARDEVAHRSAEPLVVGR